MLKNNPKLKNKIQNMYSWCHDSMINSFLEGIIGDFWCNNYSSPESAAIFTGDFAYLSGKPCDNKELISILKGKNNHLVIVPQSDNWYEPLENAGLELKKTVRFHTAIPGHGFSSDNLNLITGKINEISGAKLRKINETDYYLLKECTWENAFVSNFKDYHDYSCHGFGYIIYINEEIASCTSTFGYYSKGVEIQVATNPKYRKKGLAKICSAAFILHCIETNKIPHWDAANEFSLKIAQKLGYIPDGEYIAYEKF